MDDADRAFVPLIVLMVLWLVIIFIMMGPMQLDVIYILDHSMLWFQGGLLVVFWILAFLTPRYRHYNRAFNE